MLAEYTGVLVIFAIALALVGAILGIHLSIGPRRSFAAKQQPLECSERRLSPPRRHIAVEFFLVALLFLVFDVAAVYFYPWGAVFRELGWFGTGAMAVFTLPLAVGLFYAWLKGGLEW